LERGENPCSISTLHRILRENKLSAERRDQRPAQHNAIPRLSASQINEVWTWDCSKLATTTRGVYLTLYTIIDLFSRYVVAWMVSYKENTGLAQQLFDEATARYAIQAEQLTVHQDRGSPMIAHRYIDQMFNMGITLSHSRPRVSNDNAFSESQFKTLKYQPDYPGKFTHSKHATTWCAEYFHWYNGSHHHSGLAGYTPEQVFTGRYRQVAERKQAALDERYQSHPERFVKGRPLVKMPPNCVQINPVTEQEIEEGASTAVNFPTLNRVKDKYKVTSI
jgi:putative transposase